MGCVQFPALRNLTDRVQILVHLRQCQTKRSGVALKDLLVFQDEVITQHNKPLSTTETLQYRKRCPLPREQ